MAFSDLPKFKDIRVSIYQHPTKRYKRKSVSAFTHIVIHHSLTKSGSAESYARYHVDHHGWPGIGYHFVIEKDGTIKYCNTITLMSYHAGKHNGYCIGVCLTGDFRTQEPTDEQCKALRALHTELKRQLPNYKKTVGHSDLPGYEWKACPEFDYKAVLAGSNPGGSSWDGKSFPGRDAFKIGKRHPAVKVLDERLIAHGYDKNHDGDGYQPGTMFTKYTRMNVKDFQLAQGWSGSGADGYPGPLTWERLMEPAKDDGPFDQYEEDELPTAPNGARLTRTLKLTSPMQKGKDVEAVQSHAYVKKHLKGSVDGIFGPDTEQAVEKYQKEHGIKVTGEVGDANWKYLFGKKEDKNDDYIRVQKDGKQVGAFLKKENAIDKVERLVDSGDTINVK